MDTTENRTVSLISRWFLRPGSEAEGWAALQELAAQVFANEPDTLTYLVHKPYLADARLTSLPPVDPISVQFFEVYRDADAFLRHVHGPTFKQFVKQYGELFVADADGHRFTTVEFMTLQAGFSRSSLAINADAGAITTSPNEHPSVMFEVIANDQRLLKNFYGEVFGWSYEPGVSGFAYVHFPVRTQPLLGGIGQTDPTVPGFEPGHNFYLLVDDLEATIDCALKAGGSSYMSPANADGYDFAMIKDPEGNPIGLIKPFKS